MKFDALVAAFTHKELPESVMELTGDVPFESVAPYREIALAHIASEMEMPGFRKGNIPPEMVLKKIGELAVLEEAVELFVRDFYPELIVAKEIDAVGRPDIRITKLAIDNPISLVIHVSVYPKVALPKKWKDIAEGVNLETPTPATDEEVDKTLESLRDSRHAPAASGALDESAESPAPVAIDDEFARSVGAFADLADLKTKVREGITEEKARAARDKRRGAIIEKLLDDTKMELPRIFVESELEKILAQLKDDVARVGLTLEDYLKRIGKEEGELRAEFTDQAARRAKLQLVLNEIAKEENITADDTAVEDEMKHALQHFKDANPELLRIHIQTVLRNEKVLQLLEGNDKK